jgi:hypothetical protein
MLTTKTSANYFRKYLSEFKKQSVNPPGKDPVIAACYQALVALSENKKVKTFLYDILEKRAFTPSHFVNLLFRAVQYLEIYHLKNDRYPHDHTSSDVWKRDLKALVSKHRDSFEDILLNRDTTTTIYQRYAGAKIVLNAFFKNKKIKVADFGCGGNYGLPGLVKNHEFDDLEDRTSGKRVASLLAHPLKITDGTAIDKEDPREAASKAWLLACSFYPQELAKSARILILEAELKDVKKIAFVKENVLEFNSHNKSLQPATFDAVIMSTFLYQLNTEEQKLAIKQARKLLHRHGIIIIQDFASKNRRAADMLLMKNSWFSKPFLYRTFVVGNKTGWRMKEVLRWSNGRCRVVKAGSDFYDIIKGG